MLFSPMLSLVENAVTVRLPASDPTPLLTGVQTLRYRKTTLGFIGRSLPVPMPRYLVNWHLTVLAYSGGYTTSGDFCRIR